MEKWAFKSAAQRVRFFLIEILKQLLFIKGVDSASTGGTWDISDADRLGKSEVTLVNTFIEGMAKIIKWEQALEQGENIDEQVNAL